MDRQAALRAGRVKALTLGVAGTGPAAERLRLAVARRIRQEQQAVENEAYRRVAESRRFPVDPDVPAPFGLNELLTAEGCIQKVVDDPGFALAVMRHMGRGWREVIVSDEDGTRWTSLAPTADDYRAAAHDAARIRAVLRANGLIRPPGPEHRVPLGFPSPARRPPVDLSQEFPF